MLRSEMVRADVPGVVERAGTEYSIRVFAFFAACTSRYRVVSPSWLESERRGPWQLDRGRAEQRYQTLRLACEIWLDGTCSEQWLHSYGAKLYG